MSDFFPDIALRDGQDGSEALVDTPVKGALAAPFDLPPLSGVKTIGFMAVDVREEMGPSACHPFLKSMVGGVRLVSGKGGEGFQSVVAKDKEPLAELKEINLKK